MKALRLYTGNESSGDCIEIAQGENGRWFFRDCINTYNSNWSKWHIWTGETRIMPGRISKSVIEDDYIFEFGFTELKKYHGKLSIRLPNL